MISSLRILLFLAWRSLWSHKGRNVVVGSLVFFGTLVVTAGSAIIDTMERTMAESVVESLAGHVQVYSSKARDSLSLFGSTMMSREDLDRIPDFDKVRTELEALPDVSTVIPMAIETAQVVGGNDFDRLLDAMRQALAARDASLVHELAALLRSTATELLKDYEKQRTLADLTADEEAAVAAMREASSEGFWSDFDALSSAKIEFLELRVARFADQFDMPMYVRYVATDPDLFAAKFPKFEIVEGAPIPKGERGFLFNKRFHDEVFRNRVLHRIEKIREGLAEGRTLATDPKLRAHVEKNRKEYMRLVMRVLPGKLAALDAALARAPSAFPDDAALREVSDRGGVVRALLDMNDANVKERIAFLDAQIRPLIREYEVSVGDSLDVRSFTRTGYMRTARIKVFGVFRFKGIDRSDVAGSHNILDLATFRDLYGFVTDERRQEMESIRAAAGVADIARENAEEALFGDGSPGAAPLPPPPANEPTAQRPVLNAAVILRSPERIDEALASINKLARERNLEIQAVDWKAASGIVGQFVTIVRAVLIAASIVVFIAALAIINNSMIISTMERVGEIGTLRAIGAQRRFVLALFVLETLMLGLVAGSAGLASAAGIVAFLHRTGIPAASDQLAFLFGGERLYPTISYLNMIVGLGSVVVVSLLAAFYPARVAARVPPIVALQAKE